MSQPLNWQQPGEPSYFAEGACNRLYAVHRDVADPQLRWALITWWYGDAPDFAHARHFRKLGEAMAVAQSLECFAACFEPEFEAEP